MHAGDAEEVDDARGRVFDAFQVIPLMPGANWFSSLQAVKHVWQPMQRSAFTMMPSLLMFFSSFIVQLRPS